MTPRLSVVVPVRNGAESLGRCLASIARAAAVAGGGVEVIVADNGSVDGSPRVARDHHARVISVPGVRVSVVRNRAARTSDAPIVAFVDADHEVGPGWVKAALAALADPGVVAAGSDYLPPPRPTWVQQTYDALRAHAPGRRDVEWLPSGNLAIRRAALLRTGGFDETLETCEDVDLCRRLTALGRIVSDDRMASVHHGDPATLGAVFLGELWRGRDNVRVSLRAPRSTRSLLTAVQPVATVAGAAALLTAAVARPSLAPRVLPALAGFVLLASAPRVVLMWRRAGGVGWTRRLQCAALALTFDLGRAAALVVRAGHRVRRGELARRRLARS